MWRAVVLACVCGVLSLGSAGCADDKEASLVDTCASYCRALVRCGDYDYRSHDACMRDVCRDTPTIPFTKGQACASALTRTLDCASKLSCDALYDYEYMTSDMYPCRNLEDREYEVCDW